MPRKKKEPKGDSGSSTAKTPQPLPAEESKTSQSVQAWVQRINKDKRFQGKAQIRIASDVQSPYIVRRPTGIMSLDIALGGGFHAGGGVQIVGPESVGKTLLAYMTAGQVQMHYGDDAAILLLCTELKPDKGYARYAKFCMAYSDEEIAQYEALRVMKGLPPFTDDEKADLKFQIGNVIVVVADLGDTILNVAIDALDSGAFQLVVLDSLGALLTESEDEKEVGERSFGGSSTILTQFQNKIYQRFILDRDDGSVLQTTLLGINQARANIDGGMYGPKERPAAGAYAWRHGQLVSVELRGGSAIKTNEKNSNKIIGKEVRWKLAKGKAGTHDGKTGEYNYYHLDYQEPVFWRDVLNAEVLTGVDTVTDAIETARKLGIVQVSGAWFCWLDDDGKAIIRSQGSEKIASELMANPELVKNLRDQCVRRSGLMVKYR